MKRAFSFFLLLLLAAAMSGCAAKGGGSVLGYRDRLREACADVAVGDCAYRVKWTLGDAPAIEILSPDGIKGCSFVREGTNTYAVYEEMKIPLSKDLAAGVAPFFELFELSDEDINSISKTKDNKTEVIAVRNGTTYTLYQNEDGLPEKISVKGEREFEASNFDYVPTESDGSAAG